VKRGGGDENKQRRGPPSVYSSIYVDEIVLHSRAAFRETVPLEGACDTVQP
jgi:hypothetical protein